MNFHTLCWSFSFDVKHSDILKRCIIEEPAVTMNYKITSIVPKVAKLSLEDRSKLDLDSDFCFFLVLNLGIVMPPVIKFEVDLESSFISDILERSITDLESFLSADGVKLLSNTSRAASVSNASLSTWGQIYFDVTPLKNFFNISLGGGM